MKTHQNILLGLLLVFPLFAQAAPANLLVNGDFETGSLSGWTGTNILYGGVNSSKPQSGTYAYDPLNGSGDGTEIISQSFADVAGTTLYFDGWVDSFATVSTDFFKIAINGVNMISQFGSSPTDVGYQEFNFSFVATGNDTLSISSIVTPIPAHTYFDTLSVSAQAPVPEPGTYALMLAGLLTVGGIARRRRLG